MSLHSSSAATVALRAHYDDQVVVSLSADPSSPSCQFPNRQLLLSKDKPVASIGRTSKRDAAFDARPSNAYFASAIMSRNHAKVEFNAKNREVSIVDTGSLHGTFLDDSKLGSHMRFVLASGQTLSFGVPIERGYETHSPLKMRVGLQYGTTKRPENSRPVVFSVPDDSDVDDLEEDDDISELDQNEASQIADTVEILEKHGFRPERPEATLGVPQAPVTERSSSANRSSKVLTIVDLTTFDEDVPATKGTDVPADLAVWEEEAQAEASSPVDESFCDESVAYSEASDEANSVSSKVAADLETASRQDESDAASEYDDASQRDMGFDAFEDEEHEAGNVGDNGDNAWPFTDSEGFTGTRSATRRVCKYRISDEELDSGDFAGTQSTTSSSPVSKLRPTSQLPTAATGLWDTQSPAAVFKGDGLGGGKASREWVADKTTPASQKGQPILETAEGSSKQQQHMRKDLHWDTEELEMAMLKTTARLPRLAELDQTTNQSTPANSTMSRLILADDFIAQYTAAFPAGFTNEPLAHNATNIMDKSTDDKIIDAESYEWTLGDSAFEFNRRRQAAKADVTAPAVPSATTEISLPRVSSETVPASQELEDACMSGALLGKDVEAAEVVQVLASCIDEVDGQQHVDAPQTLDKSQGAEPSRKTGGPEPDHSNKRKFDEVSQDSTEDTTQDIAQASVVVEPSTREPSPIATLPEASSNLPIIDGSPRPPKRLRRVAEAMGLAVLGGAAVMSALIATAPTF
jgi:hypothetical protein